MAELVSFRSPEYFVLAIILIVARGMDFLSTWVATPNLILEGNPIARRLGWRGGIILNLAISGVFALWPLPAIIVATSSFLLAARNFQSAWIMRAMGEERYRSWIADLMNEKGRKVYLLCLVAQTMLIGCVGAGLICFSSPDVAPFAIGLGVITYALSVLIFSLISVWRIRPIA